MYMWKCSSFRPKIEDKGLGPWGTSWHRSYPPFLDMAEKHPSILSKPQIQGFLVQQCAWSFPLPLPCLWRWLHSSLMTFFDVTPLSTPAPYRRCWDSQSHEILRRWKHLENEMFAISVQRRKPGCVEHLLISDTLLNFMTNCVTSILLFKKIFF